VRADPPPAVTLTLRPVTAQQLEDLVLAHDASALQLPQWASVKPEWRGERVGWFTSHDRLVAGALVLYRTLPRIPRSFAYVPEGPVVAEAAGRFAADPARLLAPLARHATSRGAFALRIGPRIAVRRWQARTIRDGISGGAASLEDLTPDVEEADGRSWTAGLAEAGWQACPRDLGDGQPTFVVGLELGRTEEELRAAMNQQWRRNLNRSAKAGVVVREATAADVVAFEDLYVETAARQHFTPRPRGYLTGMLTKLAPHARLHVAVHEDRVLAGALCVRTGRRVCYQYGASTADDRTARAANALHWQIVREANASGATLYDLRGVTPGLAESDPQAGLIRFKAGFGGTATEYIGEWEIVLRPLWYRAYRTYVDLRRR